MKPITIKNKTIGTGKPKVCISLMGKDQEEILCHLEKMQKYSFDIVEWRIDYVKDVSIENIVSIAKAIQRKDQTHILLCTFRTKKEGGEKDLSAEEYYALYQALIEDKCCDMIDVEMYSQKTNARKITLMAHMKEIYVVGSYHDFNKTDSEENIVNRMVVMQFCDADICKIAMMPNCKEDVYRLMRATHTMKEKYASRPLITMSMSEIGEPSRILGELFGSSVTFGCAHKASAPGQIEVGLLNEMLEDVHLHKEESIKKYIK